ncbi:MAG: apolipoprotein N-acyltransferase [Treponema sp.]|nr:apolipoprotein N-acyltransferase [Treponema sp.]
MGLFCLIPLYLALYRAKSYREAFGLFALQTFTVHLFSSWWLYNFHGFAVWSLGASALGTAVLGGLTGMVIFFLPRQLSFNKQKTELEEAGGRRIYLIPARILWFASSFVFWEWIKSTGFLAYPWGTLFMTAYKWKIMTQIADITGVWGVTFVFALFNALVAEGLNVIKILVHSQRPDVPAYTYKKTAKAAVIIIGITAVYGIFQYLVPRNVKKVLNTVIVQQNVDPWEGGDDASISISSRLTEREVNKMRDSGKEPDLVLWSEGALTYTFPTAIDRYSEEPRDESLTSFIRRMNVPFLIGGSSMTDREHRKISNSAILFDREGEYAGFYSKIHMVPFAEEVPFMDNPLMAAFMKNVVGMPYTLTPGNQYVIFKIPLSSSHFLTAPLRDGFETYGTIELDTNGRADPEAAMKYRINYDENPDSYVKFSAPICFEDAFPDVCTPLFNSGSEIFLNITNDSWSKTPSSEYQHFIVASFLAIEYRTTLVRCANAGYSVVVAPNGKILNDMDVFTEDAIGCSVPIYERKATIFSILGDWFAYLVFTFMALYFAVRCVIFNFKRIRQSPAIQKLAKSILKDDEIQEEEEAESQDEEQLESEDTAKTETIDTGWQPLFIPEYTPEVTLAKPLESAGTRPTRKRTRTVQAEKTKTAAKKTPGKKPPVKKTSVIKTPVKKAAEEKVTHRKANTAASTAKKTTATKTTASKTTARKTTAAKTAGRKATAAKTTATKTAATRKTQEKSNTRGRKRESKK